MTKPRRSWAPWFENHAKRGRLSPMGFQQSALTVQSFEVLNQNQAQAWPRTDRWDNT